MKEELGKRIHRAILNDGKVISFKNKQGKTIRTFEIGLLSLREVVRISLIAYSTEVDKETTIESIHKMITLHSEKVVDAISIMLKSRSRLPRWYIKRIIRNYTTSTDLFTLMNLVYDAMAVTPFLNSIILLKGMSLLKKEEIIASESLKTESKKARKKNVRA